MAQRPIAMLKPTSSVPFAAARHTLRSWRARFLLIVVCLLALDAAWAQNSAGVVMSVAGQAKAIDLQARERVLVKGAELFAGDKVQTADASLVQMRLHDGGYISVRPNTVMVLDRFEHDQKEPAKSNFLVSLLQGGFRSITGLIGRSNPNGYQIRTSTATIGIRGTDHEPVLVLDTPEAQLQTQAPPGLYDKVNDGETFISSQGSVLALRRGDVGFVPLAANVPPQVLLKIPEFYKLDLKTDARDAKDGAGADGNRRAGAGTLMRPSVAARREAQAAGGGSGTAPTNPNTAPPAAAPNTPINPTSPIAAPTRPAPAATGTATGTNTVLTPEQKRAVVQAITPTAPRTTTPTPVAPIAPTAPTAPTAPPPAPTQR
ncbi:FecR domain-containing protein [Rhodoferax sp. AJA081-3]|uniref:FecR family protein n=1 Tax=Rhodoferax sp. AJA081-3 TaxID=2752316 RepID=UPI001ADF6153|nr:FecR domain-containing protein [Rhodoferax sp. AJA081-3]QTN29948.1 FecR domain-containing protein [Rhodoferax sp. AJA081-3]